MTTEFVADLSVRHVHGVPAYHQLVNRIPSGLRVRTPDGSEKKIKHADAHVILTADEVATFDFRAWRSKTLETLAEDVANREISARRAALEAQAKARIVLPRVDASERYYVASIRERAVRQLIDDGVLRPIGKSAVSLAVEHGDFRPAAEGERVIVACSPLIPDGVRLVLGYRDGLPVVLDQNPARALAVTITDGEWSTVGAEPPRHWIERVRRENGRG